jgi:hypothetical protein
VDIFFASYKNLTEGGYAFFYDTQYHVAELGHAYAYKDPPPGQEFYGYPRTVPGAFGAKAAKLYQILEAGHNNVQLSQEEMHRIALWLDLTSPFLGVYHDVEAQLRGETVAPILE